MGAAHWHQRLVRTRRFADDYQPDGTFAILPQTLPRRSVPQPSRKEAASDRKVAERLMATVTLEATRSPAMVSVSDIGVRQSYRPDIDGLRAIAVLAVVAFHFNLGPVPGGF